MDERPADVALASQRASRRLLGILCLVYLALLFYASLMPFDFTGDRASVDAQLRLAWQFWPFGTAVHTSRADMLSNVMLYVPLGFFLATRLALNARRSRWVAFLGGMAVCGGSSLVIECGQLFSSSRITSATDVLMNFWGGTVGALAGALFGVHAWLRLTDIVRRRRAERPLVLVAGLLLVVLAADAVYPFLPTLDVGSIKTNLRNSAIWPLPRLSAAAWYHWSADLLRTGFSQNAWHHWLVQRAGVYAVLTILLGSSSTRPSPGKWIRAALLATCFAAVAEAAKPFIVSRTANAANVVSSAGGAMMGLALGRLFEGRWPARLRSLLTVLLLAAYMVYLEWMPFAFTWDLSRLAEKMPKGAQWLPLYHYAMGGTANEVRLFLRTILLVGALTCAAALRWSPHGRDTRSLSIVKAAGLAGCFGLLLEFGQFFLERVPSVTDVFCFAVGGALGYWVWTSYPQESAAYENSLHAGPDNAPR